MPNKEFDKGKQLFDLLETGMQDDYIFMADMEEDLSRWSENAVRDFGLPGTYIHEFSQYWRQLIHPEDVHLFDEDFQQIMENKKDIHECEYRAKTATGTYVWLKCRGKILRREDGTPYLFGGCVTNLGINGKFDPITNLPNMQSFIRMLVDMAGRKEEKAAVMMIDISNFSHFNEKYSYDFGNQLLKVYADRITEIKPEKAVCFRMDGDKFAVIYPDASTEEMNRYFLAVQKIARSGCEVDGKRMIFSVAGGALLCKGAELGPENVHRNLECALTYSKKHTRGALTFFSEDLMAEAMRTLQLAEDLQAGIRSGFDGFHLVYQPIMDNGCKVLLGCEALLRFTSPTLGMVSPAEFIPMLENDGGIVEVGYWVAETAMRQLEEWQKTVPELTMNINVSYIQFLDNSFKENIGDMIQKFHLREGTLILELTESCRVDDLESLSGNIAYFHDKGIKIALDDFGTGYASISILRQVETDWVKVDHHFVSQIADCQSDRAILEYIIGLCRALNIVVCVEGIENSDILKMVEACRPDCLQGYFYSRPCDAGVFESKFLADVRTEG